MYRVLNTVSEPTYFYISKSITSYTFLRVFKTVESIHCILIMPIIRYNLEKPYEEN